MPPRTPPRVHLLRGLLVVLGWLVLTAVVAGWLFLHSERAVVLASHDAVVRPTLGSDVVLHTGPVLPDVRTSSGSRLGVDITLGKTEASSTDVLIERYAYLASQPDAQIRKVGAAVREMAWSAALRGGVLALVPVTVWVLLGRTRRHELWVRLRSPAGLAWVVVAGGLVVLVWQPWSSDDDTVAEQFDWTPLADFVGPSVRLPEEAARLEVRVDATSSGTRRLIASAVDTYAKSKTFYAAAADQAAGLDLRRPEDGESVAILVSDRHDNIGMDQVARAVGDAAGATAVLDAGDDTSTGGSWEAFSLDSLDNAFDGYDKYGVAGNHDHGDFVTGYLADRGWTMLAGETVTGPGGATLIGVDDPRSSGLGSWRDEDGLSFDEVGQRLADATCAQAEADSAPVATVMVHDVDLADAALARGCADLVVGGHLHVQVGPTRVAPDQAVGPGDADSGSGWSYTNGTTGGAAYAFALGSKPRRTAEVTLVTYRDGRPVGLQWVLLETNGVFRVGGYVTL